MRRKTSSADCSRSQALPGNALPRGSASLFLLATVLALALVAPRSARALDALAERRQQVEAMSADEKEALREKFAKFAALAAEEQEQLRRLHEQLDSDPQGDSLRQTMVRYHQWLETLSPSDRADLLALPPADRLARVKTLKHDQEARAATLAGGAHLIGQDVVALWRWMEQYAANHESELLKISAGGKTKRKIEEKNRRKSLTQIAWQYWRKAKKLPNVSDAEITQLAEQVSPAARAALERQVTKTDRARMIRDWVQAISGAGLPPETSGKPGPLASDEDLSKFFQNDLTPTERDRLMELPRDELHRELRKLYAQRKHPSDVAPSTDSKPAGT